MIYRIAEPADWQRAAAAGQFTSADLAAEGFIHCSTRAQVAVTAGRYYAGRSDLVLLVIDEAKLTVPLHWEDTAQHGALFPHVYGPIALTAVVQTVPLVPGPDGTFILPAGV